MIGTNRNGSVGFLTALAIIGGGCRSADGTRKEDPAVSRITSTLIDGPSGKLRVDDAGSGGLPVLFVHGNGGNRTQWTAQLDHLRPRRRVIALDLRGHGESEPATDSDYSVQAFAGDIAAVADSLGLELFVLVRHSFGGAVAAAYSGRLPDRVAGLLLVDPAGDLSRLPRDSLQGWLELLNPQTYEAHTQEWFEQILVEAADGVSEQVFRSLRSTPRDVFVGGIIGLADFDAIASLTAYTGPKLTIITPINNEPFSLQNLVEDLPHEQMTGVSHWLMMDRPEEFNHLMDQFLVRVETIGG